MNPSFIADIKRIQQAKANNKLVVFVGAGVSNNSGVPSWNTLTEALKKELPIDNISEENDSLKVAQYYCNFRGYKEYIEKIKEVLKHGKVSCNPIHDAILDLEPSHIITTNYDDLIEQSIRPRNLQYHIIRKDSDLPYIQTDRLVVKMHGDFEVGNIVLTEKDYLDYRVNFPLIDAFVKSLFASKFILFVGFSFADYNLRFIVNYTQSLLKDDFQPVYMLVNETVNHVIKEYYKKKGIYLIEISEKELDKVLEEQRIGFSKVTSLTNPLGQVLYKQLCLINEYEESQNMIDYLYNNLKPLEDVLPVLGDGLKYFVPKEEMSFWNLYSNGLQIQSPYIKSETARIKGASFNFLRIYKTKISELAELARLNGIYEIDNVKLLSESRYERIRKKSKEDSIDLFYKGNYNRVHEEIKKLSKKKLTFTKRDLELPLILYKTGNYYEAYVKYKELSVEFWSKQKYILYFICVYNQKMLGLRAKMAAYEKVFVDEYNIEKEANNINLSSILQSCPIDKKVISVLSDLICDKSYLSFLKDINDLMLSLYDDKKLSDAGGSFMNSNIDLLIANIYRLINFGDVNNIICLENQYSKQCFKSAVAGILLSHSIKQNDLGDGFKSPKLEEINKTNLYIFLYHIKYSDLKQIFERYDIQSIILSKDAYEYVNVLLDNLLTNKKESIAVIANCKYFDVFQSLVFLLLKTDSSESKEISGKIYDVFIKCEFNKGKRAFLNYDLGIDLYGLLGIYVLKYPPAKDIAKVLLTSVLQLEKAFHKPQSFVKSITNILSKENFVLDDIQDISQINYLGISDWAYLSALYPILSLKVKEQALELLQNLKFSSEYFAIAKIYLEYNIPIFNLEVFEQYKSEINGRGLYFFNLLIKVRKDDRCSSVHEKIDEFIAESEFMKFASNPSAYTELDNIEPEWLLYCEEEDFRRLVREEVVNKKMKDSFDKDEFRGSLKKKFLREA